MTEAGGHAGAPRGTRPLGGAPVVPPEPDVGEELDDFLLVDRLGEGAFARVFLAHQKSLHRTVALKVSATRSEEAQTLAQLDHPNIVRVYDQRTVAGRELHLLYMEYVPAGTLEMVIDRAREVPERERTGRLLLEHLDGVLARRGAQPPLDSMLRERLSGASWPDVVAILGSHLAVALDYAHAQGVLHRDVKPANVLLEASGRAKLADFNISWSSQVGGSAAEYMGGSLPYMSPEQLCAASPFHEGEPEDLDRRSDVYGLGVVLWELLTGSLPWPEPVPGRGWKPLFEELVGSRRAGVPDAAVAALPASVPPMLRDLLLECLAGDRESRPESGGVLARRLELCLDPRVRDLLTPARSGWRLWVRRAPLTGLVATVLGVNGVLAYLNVQHNAKAVVAGEAAWRDFDAQVQLVNGVCFPIGIALLVWFSLPLRRGVLRRERGEPLTAEARAEGRSQALRLPGLMVAIVLPLWVIGGLVFPIWHHARTGEVDGGAYFHFTLSNLLFGVLAAMIGYFLLARIVVRALLPRLVHPGDVDAPAAARMTVLGRRIGVCFAACTLVPLVSVMVLALWPGDMRDAFGVLGLMGALTFAIAYPLAGAIRADLLALQSAVRRPTDQGSPQRTQAAQ